MPSHLKKIVRARAEKTGESYQQALRHVRAEYRPRTPTRGARRSPAKGFRRGEGAIFVWEGVIGYIGVDEIDRNMRFMAREGGARGRLVFTYAENTFEPDTAAERARRAGFRSSAEFSGDDLWRRYVPGGGEPFVGARLMKLGVAIVPAFVFEHLTTVARLHAQNRYDRRSDEVEKVTGHSPRLAGEFVARHAADFGTPSA